MIDLSIIILSYKSKDHLSVLLPSLFGSEGIGFYREGVVSPFMDFPHEADKSADYKGELIVVDNDSRDGTLEWLQTTNYTLQTISNQNNGFSKGNNVGIRKSKGRYVLLLNPDTKLEPDTLKKMLDLMESRPDIGISGCKLIKANGKLDLACRRRFPNPWNSFQRLFLHNNTDYNYSNISEDQEMEVDSVVGAFLLIRRSVIDLIGLLDEDFFMYGEDLDWCWRAKAEGFKVWYYPKAICHHYKGESSRKTPFIALKWFHDSMWVFYKKHYAKKYFFVFNWLVAAGIYGRLAVLTTMNLFKSEPRVSR